MGGTAGAMTAWPFACRDHEVESLETELDRTGRGAVITGEGGVGKSRVLHELCDRLERSGATVHRVVATRSLSAVPYGALASTFSSVVTHRGDELLTVQATLTEMRGDDSGRGVLALDDAHLLDAESAALAALAAQNGIAVLTTTRAGESCPDGISRLTRDDLAVRLDLGPLDREQVGELLAAVLGAPVDAHTRHRLWEITGGNVLYLRELVRAGLDRHALAEHGGVWIWSGDITGAARVHDLLHDTVQSLTPSVRRVVELLAVGEPLGAAVVADLTAPGALEDAEQSGAVVVSRSGRRLEVRLAHPIYAQVVRASLGRVRKEKLARELADRFTLGTARRADDALRVAALHLEAGAAADADVLLRAARQARQYAEVGLAEALARQAFAVCASAPAAMTLAEVLYWQGRHDEVIELLTNGVLDDAEAKHVMFGTMHIASAYFYGRGELDKAEWWIEQGIARAGPEYEADLQAIHARMLMVAGRDVECIDAAAAVLASDALARARLNAYIALLPSLAVCGRLGEVEAHEAGAFELVSSAGRGMPFPTGGVVVGLFIAHLFRGTLPSFDPTLAGLNEAATRRAEDPFRGVWTLLTGRSALAQGRLATAIPALREAAALLRLRDPGMVLPWCLASLTLALGAAGDARGAADACDELDAVRFDVTRNIEVEVELAHAWRLAAAGQRSTAADRARCVGQRLAGDGRAAVAAWAFHDALRLGAPADDVVGPLTELATVAEGAVVAAMAQHALALSRRDHGAVAIAAEHFADAGMMLHAAEAAATATRLAADAGLRGTAAALRARASELVAGCGPALTPLLEPISDRDALAALTRKEQEVALMAARGMTKRAMAESLSVSVRTVGNHINHLYAKLGVSSRDELRAVLRLEPVPAGE